MVEIKFTGATASELNLLIVEYVDRLDLERLDVPLELKPIEDLGTKAPVFTPPKTAPAPTPTAPVAKVVLTKNETVAFAPPLPKKAGRPKKIKETGVSKPPNLDENNNTSVSKLPPEAPASPASTNELQFGANPQEKGAPAEVKQDAAVKTPAAGGFLNTEYSEKDVQKAILSLCDRFGQEPAQKKKAFETAQGLLKSFGVTYTKELKPHQYQAVIDACNAVTK